MKRIFIISIISIRGLCSFAQALSDNWIASYRSKAGVHHVIALSNGQVMTWQAGGEMQPLQGLDNAAQVSGGEEHLLVLDKNGYVFTLGNNNYFQLGDAELVQKKIKESINPVKVKGIKNAVAISAFGNTNYALLKDGTVWACKLQYPGPPQRRYSNGMGLG